MLQGMGVCLVGHVMEVQLNVDTSRCGLAKRTWIGGEADRRVIDCEKDVARLDTARLRGATVGIKP